MSHRQRCTKTVPEMVKDEVVGLLHPSLLKFEAPDIGLLYPQKGKDFLLGDREKFLFFIHPMMLNREDDHQNGERLMLHFPMGFNDFDKGKSINGRTIDREDTVVRIPSATYLRVYPEANLLIELPF